MKVTYEITAIMDNQVLRRKCYSIYEAQRAWLFIKVKNIDSLKKMYCRFVITKNKYRVLHKETLWKSYFINGKEYVCPPCNEDFKKG